MTARQRGAEPIEVLERARRTPRRFVVASAMTRRDGMRVIARTVDLDGLLQAAREQIGRVRGSHRFGDAPTVTTTSAP